MEWNKDQFMQYANAAISLETEVATQKSIIDIYNQNSLSRKPQLSLQEMPDRPSSPDYEVLEMDWRNNSFGTLGMGPFLGILMGVIFFIIGGIFLFAYPPAGLAVLAVGMLCLLPYIIKKRVVSNRNNNASENYQNALTKYEQSVESIKKSNASATEIYHSNVLLWQKNNEENLAELGQQLSMTESLLDQLYSKEFIFGKYRNLPALTSIYEYFITGRCDELIGPHGAYNLYEDELRKDTVISQLSTVIDNLEQIKQNQYLLYQQAKQIKDESVRISQEIQQIAGFTYQLTQLSELQTYYTALTAKCSQISATMHLING